jgi:hypothetical protein
MLNFPLRTLLQKGGIAAARIKREPTMVVADPRDLLVRVAHIVKREVPMCVSLIG